MGVGREKKGEPRAALDGDLVLGLFDCHPQTINLIPRIEVELFGWAGFDAIFDLRVAYYSLTFAFAGFASSGMFTGRMTYVLDISPEDRRPTYTSFLNAAMLPQGVLPVLGGWLVALISYQNMFIVSLLFVPVAIWMAGKLKAVKA